MFYFTADHYADRVEIIFSLPSDPVFHADRRGRDALDLVARSLTRAGINIAHDRDGRLLFQVDVPQKKQIASLLRGIERRVTSILTASLDPNTVDRILGVTARERLRWYECDGTRLSRLYERG
jgi:hypothetical protein